MAYSEKLAADEAMLYRRQAVHGLCLHSFHCVQDIMAVVSEDEQQQVHI